MIINHQPRPGKIYQVLTYFWVSKVYYSNYTELNVCIDNKELILILNVSPKGVEFIRLKTLECCSILFWPSACVELYD
jgi:hypothetical protein